MKDLETLRTIAALASVACLVVNIWIAVSLHRMRAHKPETSDECPF